MNYWHIQMNLPEGRESGRQIDSSLMLRESPPIIGTGEWDDIQCRYFKNEDGRGLQNNDIVLVREGKKPLAIVQIVGENFIDVTLTSKHVNQNFRQVRIIDWFRTNENFPQPQGTLQKLINKSTDSYLFIDNWYKRMSKENEINELIDVLLAKYQLVLQGPPGTGKTYTAKDIAEKLIFDSISEDKKIQKDRLESSHQFKLVQFHPSYTYEDFVRGIEAQGTESGIEYNAVEKHLSLFARKATENWVNHFSNPVDVHRKNWISEKFDLFIEHISQEFANSINGQISLTDSVYIMQIDDDCLRYRGDAWAKSSRINYSDLRNIIEINLDGPDNPIIPASISKHAFHRSSYYGAVLKKFFDYSGHYESAETEQEELKKFVLIIDELNRANLPSVLGELIYALEYRGENIETVYEVEGSRTMQLPKNLFIIGTMNTADRSVGHIDYAIRRRFAFVDILPDESVITTVEGKSLFKKVSDLFINAENQTPSLHLSPDFKYKDVQLGHSYFIGDVDKLKNKLKYEIKPILLEYLKDGILLPSAENSIESISIT